MASSAAHLNVLMLEGGGALGAYQAGVFDALCQQDWVPDWVAGISIGAVNAAIIAGNAPADRLERLRAFWDLVTSRLPGRSLLPGQEPRRWFNEFAAANVMAFGVPGFFQPRPLFDWAMPELREPLSLYDHGPLRQTLLDHVDFDRLNAGPMRVSIGAASVRTGELVFFDNRSGRIEPEHVMASGALPPSFPPVMIDGEAYWDGGIITNTPLEHVLAGARDTDLAIVGVELYHARGALPGNFSQMMRRHKDIRHASRSRMATEMVLQAEALRLAAARLAARLPAELADDPDARMLAAQARSGRAHLLQLVDRRDAFAERSQDHEFSRQSINGHWQAGLDDAQASLGHPEWQARSQHQPGFVIYDLNHPAGPQVRSVTEIVRDS